MAGNLPLSLTLLGLFQMLPDELILACVDSSMRMCVQLAATCFPLFLQLRIIAYERGLRLMCRSVQEAMQIQRQCICFHIGELVLVRHDWTFNNEADFVPLLLECLYLHTIRVDPKYFQQVMRLQRKRWFNRVKQNQNIDVLWRVAKRVQPTQRQITEFLPRVVD